MRSFENALKIAEHVYDENHINLMEYLSALGGFYKSRRQLDKAVECYMRITNLGSVEND